MFGGGNPFSSDSEGKAPSTPGGTGSPGAEDRPDSPRSNTAVQAEDENDANAESSASIKAGGNGASPPGGGGDSNGSDSESSSDNDSSISGDSEDLESDEDMDPDIDAGLDAFDGVGVEGDEWWDDDPFAFGMFDNIPEDAEDGWDAEELEAWFDEDDDGAWGWDHGTDSDSDASTVEPAEEAEACDRAVDLTANRHLLHPPAPYILPSSTFHFQSADAMAVCADPCDPGSLLVATMDSDGVLLFRLPVAAGGSTKLGGPPQAMEFVGGFESPSLSAYTMEMSPSGRYLVAGGDEGSLEIYTINSRARQRPPVPAEVQDSLSVRQPYFYLPIILPESDWVTGSRPQRVAQEIHDLLTGVIDGGEVPVYGGDVPENYPRTRNDANFLNLLGFRDTAFLTPANAAEVAAPERPDGAEPVKRSPLGWVPRDMFFAAAVDEQFRGLHHQFNSFVTMVGGKDKIHWTMEEEHGLEQKAADFGESSAAPSASPQATQHGALALGGMLILGFPDVEEASVNTMNMEGMVNGVRFGLVANKERLLAADQSGKVYVFEVPPDDCPVENICDSMMCESLGNPSPHWSMQPVVAFSSAPNPLGAELQRRAVVMSTATLGPFGSPLNLAAASPDGKWIALVGDRKKVILLDQSNGFSPRELSFEPARFDYDFLDPEVEVGSQYCAWNRSSTLLAVTSDSLHAVFVFSIPSGELVLRVEGYVRSVMPVTFAWDDNTLIFAEESKMLHVRVVDRRNGIVDYNAREDLADPGPSSQLLRVPLNHSRPKGSRRRITGMATTAQGDLLVSTKQGIMFRYFVSKSWVPEDTKYWPEDFKRIAQTVLLCGSRRDAKNPLASLPLPVLYKIIEALAGYKSDWMETVAEQQP